MHLNSNHQSIILLDPLYPPSPAIAHIMPPRVRKKTQSKSDDESSDSKGVKRQKTRAELEYENELVQLKNQILEGKVKILEKDKQR
jgi:hypothetical protein